MSSAYLFCAIVGLGWTVANFALGKVLGGGGGGGGEVGVGHDFGVDGGGHGDAFADGGGGDAGLPLFSPTAFASYVTGFGSTGLIVMQGFGVHSPWVHVPISLGGAALLGLSVVTLMAKLMRVGETSSEARISAIAGRTGELTVAIPAGGLGELTYLAGGVRSSAPARSLDGAPLERQTSVRIVRVEGPVFVVASLSPAPSGRESSEDVHG